jgi:hypothetical protein
MTARFTQYAKTVLFAILVSLGLSTFAMAEETAKALTLDPKPTAEKTVKTQAADPKSTSQDGMVKVQLPAEVAKILATWQKREIDIKEVLVKYDGEKLTPRGTLSEEWKKSFPDREPKIVPEEDLTSKQTGIYAIDQGRFGLATEEKRFNMAMDGLEKCARKFTAHKMGIRLLATSEHAAFPVAVLIDRIQAVAPIGSMSDVLGINLIYRPISVIKAFRPQISETKIVNDNIDINGKSTVELEIPIGTAESEKMLFWVDPKNEYFPVKFQIVSNNSPIVEIRLFYKEDADKQLTPARWETDNYDHQKPDQLKISAKATVTQFAIGGEVPASLFDFEIPVGTLVQKHGSEGVEKYFLLEEGKRTSPEETEKRIQELTRPKNPLLSWGLLIGCLIFLYLFFRKRDKPKNVDTIADDIDQDDVDID